MGELELFDEGARKTAVGTMASEKAINAVGDRGGVTTFPETPDFSWGVGKCCVNKEPVETSWELDLR